MRNCLEKSIFAILMLFFTELTYCYKENYLQKLYENRRPIFKKCKDDSFTFSNHAFQPCFDSTIIPEFLIENENADRYVPLTTRLPIFNKAESDNYRTLISTIPSGDNPFKYIYFAISKAQPSKSQQKNSIPSSDIFCDEQLLPLLYDEESSISPSKKIDKGWKPSIAMNLISDNVGTSTNYLSSRANIIPPLEELIKRAIRDSRIISSSNKPRLIPTSTENAEGLFGFPLIPNFDVDPFKQKFNILSPQEFAKSYIINNKMTSKSPVNIKPGLFLTSTRTPVANFEKSIPKKSTMTITTSAKNHEHSAKTTLLISTTTLKPFIGLSPFTLWPIDELPLYTLSNPWDMIFGPLLEHQQTTQTTYPPLHSTKTKQRKSTFTLVSSTKKSYNENNAADLSEPETNPVEYSSPNNKSTYKKSVFAAKLLTKFPTIPKDASTQITEPAMIKTSETLLPSSSSPFTKAHLTQSNPVFSSTKFTKETSPSIIPQNLANATSAANEIRKTSDNKSSGADLGELKTTPPFSSEVFASKLTTEIPTITKDASTKITEPAMIKTSETLLPSSSSPFTEAHSTQSNPVFSPTKFTKETSFSIIPQNLSNATSATNEIRKTSDNKNIGSDLSKFVTIPNTDATESIPVSTTNKSANPVSSSIPSQILTSQTKPNSATADVSATSDNINITDNVSKLETAPDLSSNYFSGRSTGSSSNIDAFYAPGLITKIPTETNVDLTIKPAPTIIGISEPSHPSSASVFSKADTTESVPVSSTNKFANTVGSNISSQILSSQMKPNSGTPEVSETSKNFTDHLSKLETAPNSTSNYFSGTSTSSNIDTFYTPGLITEISTEMNVDSTIKCEPTKITISESSNPSSASIFSNADTTESVPVSSTNKFANTVGSNISSQILSSQMKPNSGTPEVSETYKDFTDHLSKLETAPNSTSNYFSGTSTSSNIDTFYTPGLITEISTETNVDSTIKCEPTKITISESSNPSSASIFSNANTTESVPVSSTNKFANTVGSNISSKILTNHTKPYSPTAEVRETSDNINITNNLSVLESAANSSSNYFPGTTTASYIDSFSSPLFRTEISTETNFGSTIIPEPTMIRITEPSNPSSATVSSNGDVTKSLSVSSTNEFANTKCSNTSSEILTNRTKPNSATAEDHETSKNIADDLSKREAAPDSSSNSSETTVSTDISPTSSKELIATITDTAAQTEPSLLFSIDSSILKTAPDSSSMYSIKSSPNSATKTEPKEPSESLPFNKCLNKSSSKPSTQIVSEYNSIPPDLTKTSKVSLYSSTFPFLATWFEYKGNGYFSNPDDPTCATFIRCFKKSKFETCLMYKCKKDHYFNEKTSTCEFMYDCKNQTTDSVLCD